MIASLGVGVPEWPVVADGWDLWPLVGVVFALAVLRWGLGLRIGPLALLAAIVAGPLVSISVHALGGTVTAGLAFATWLLALAARRSLRRPT